jgi:hypothetical protein
MPAYHGKEQNFSMPVYHGKEQNFNMPAYHGKEQNFSMPVYHGKSKFSVYRHILAWAKFQYAGISWHQPKSPITVYFGSPADEG